MPVELQEHIGRTEIVTTLQTRDLSVAQSKRWAEREKWERIFADLRNPTSRAPRDVYNETLEYAHELGVDDTSEYGDFSELELWKGSLVEQHVQRKDLKCDQDRAAADTILRAKLDALDDYGASLNGRRTTKRKKYGLSVSECGQAWLRDNEANLTHQTIGQYQAVVRLFSEFLDDRPMNEVKRADVAKFLDEVSTFDPNWGRSPRTKERTYNELKKMYAGQGKRLANRTLNRYLSAISQAWQWAKVRDEAIGENPTLGLFKSTKGKQSATYHAMPIRSLNALFRPPQPTFKPIWEVAVVALFSGMRLNEICSLDWPDIQTSEGIKYFDITASKTEAGVRKVPVHSSLEWLLKRSGSEGPIWPELKPGGPDQKRSWYLSRRFGEFKRARGIDDRRLVFHSLRKNFVQCLERANVDQSRAAQIVGHESAGITYRIYNPDGLSIQQRRETVELARYPDLRLPDEFL